MKWHYEVIAEYPNGGKDVVKVIDELDPPAPVYASRNYNKYDGLFEGGKTMYALKNIANGELLVAGQNVSEDPIEREDPIPNEEGE